MLSNMLVAYAGVVVGFVILVIVVIVAKVVELIDNNTLANWVEDVSTITPSEEVGMSAKPYMRSYCVQKMQQSPTVEASRYWYQKFLSFSDNPITLEEVQRNLLEAEVRVPVHTTKEVEYA